MWKRWLPDCRINDLQNVVKFMKILEDVAISRVLATVKNYVVNTVLQIWSIIELPNLFPKYLIQYQKIKIDSEIKIWNGEK